MAKKETNKTPMMESCVMAGFPSPAEQYIEQALDLNELLVKHPSGTFFVIAEKPFNFFCEGSC